MPQTLPRLHFSLRRLTLRQRILLLFLGLAGASVAALCLALYLGHAKHPSPWAMEALITAGVVAGCAIVGLILGLWRLFDENVAKPLERLSGELRARVHANISTDLEDLQARHLGDLAPAATALMRHLNEARNELAETIARETARHVAEKEHLNGLLADLPVGVIVCTADHHLVFYNAAARAALGGNSEELCAPGTDTGGTRQPCLGRSLFDFLEEAPLRAALDHLTEAKASAGVAAPMPLTCRLAGSETQITLHLRLLGETLDSAPGAQAYLLTLLGPAEALPLPRLTAQGAPDEPPPAHLPPEPMTQGVVYDFELLERDLQEMIVRTPMQALTYVVFDTETTGLFPDRGDEIVQLAAVRVVNGRRVLNEVFDTLVNPGRPIPPSSTLIHGISDDMVADAPSIDEVARQFHAFARGAVLVAHNIDFDLSFLKRVEPRIGLRFDHPVLDTAELSASVFGDGENHSLDALAARLGVALPPSARHTALGDATATADILIKLLPALQSRS